MVKFLGVGTDWIRGALLGEFSERVLGKTKVRRARWSVAGVTVSVSIFCQSQPVEGPA